MIIFSFPLNHWDTVVHSASRSSRWFLPSFLPLSSSKDRGSMNSRSTRSLRWSLVVRAHARSDNSCIAFLHRVAMENHRSARSSFLRIIKISIAPRI